MRILKNICALLSERTKIIDYLHSHQALVMFDEETSAYSSLA